MIYTHINFKRLRKQVCIVAANEEHTAEYKKKQITRNKNDMHKWKRFQIAALTLTVFGETFTKLFRPFAIWFVLICHIKRHKFMKRIHIEKINKRNLFAEQNIKDAQTRTDSHDSWWDKFFEKYIDLHNKIYLLNAVCLNAHAHFLFWWIKPNGKRWKIVHIHTVRKQCFSFFFRVCVRFFFALWTSDWCRSNSSFIVWLCCECAKGNLTQGRIKGGA